MHKFVLSAAIACLLLLAGQSSASAAPPSQTFTFTGAEQPFTVPAGVTSMHVVAIGAKGGKGSQTPAAGGFGSVVSADVAVTPGDVVKIVVAGNGGDAVGAVGGTGGFSGRGGGGGGGGGAGKIGGKGRG